MKSRQDKLLTPSFRVLTVARQLPVSIFNMSTGNRLWRTLKKYKEMRRAVIACL
jgi:hypothetical protein